MQFSEELIEICQANYKLSPKAAMPFQYSEIYRRTSYRAKKKTKKLKKVLLPISSFADLSNIQGFEYLNRLEMPKITQHEILQTIKHLQTKKAPGPNQIPNKILKIIADKICSFLKKIFNNSLALDYYHSHFKESTLVILHKIGDN